MHHSFLTYNPDDYLVERSIDLQDSEILDDYGNLFDVHTILELAA